jgi:hypothetical protein
MDDQVSMFDEVTTRHGEFVSRRLEPSERVRFDGETYDPEQDRVRLTGQLKEVHACLTNGEWWTLPELRRACERARGKKATEQSISARIRDLRKARFGSHTIERMRDGELWLYRLVP